MGSRTGMLKKFRANFDSFEEIWLFIQMFLLVSVLPFRLKFLSLPRVMKTLAPRDFKVCRNMDMEKLKGKIVKFTDYILGRNFLIYKNTCLKRSLVLYIEKFINESECVARAVYPPPKCPPHGVGAIIFAKNVEFKRVDNDCIL